MIPICSPHCVVCAKNKELKILSRRQGMVDEENLGSETIGNLVQFRAIYV